MKLDRETELQLAAAIGTKLAAYLRNGAMQDTEDMVHCTMYQRNQAKNYLEELAIQIESGHLPSTTNESTRLPEKVTHWHWEK